MAWFPGPMEETETLFRCLRWLNRGLESGQWRTYKCREEPNEIRLEFSVDQASVDTLEGMEWRPFSGVGRAIFSLLGTKGETLVD
jgi:hypothetical protein